MINIARWRLVTLGLLFFAPFIALMVFGSFYLWEIGWGWYYTAIMLACLTVGWYLAWRWQAGKKLLSVDTEIPLHWTERDRAAWKLVEARAQNVKEVTPDQLSNVKFYADTGQEMALEMARFYHPGADDPVGKLTIPEMLAVVELVAHDMAELVEQYLPGGHLLTVNDWKRARKAWEWYPTLTNVYWAVNAIFAPYNTAVRYLVTRLGMGKPMEMLQQNLLLWFYTTYIHRLGTYLIDLNSGRLRVGAQRYRQLMESLAQKEPLAPTTTDGQQVVAVPTELPSAVIITLMGQVKAGKSSLINAFLGEQRAKTNVLPETAEITRYELNPENVASKLELLDTVGYGHTGPREDQLAATEKAAQKSDLLLLVLHARNPARQADLEMLQQLKQWFDKLPNLKMPQILAVMTHIDLLSPAMEWRPPYHWQQPVRPKEQNISLAVETVREQLGQYLVGVIPVCVAEGKVYGVEEELLPAVTRLLDQSRAVAMLRCLHAEADMNKVRKVFDQVMASGKQLVKALWSPRS